MSAITKRVEVPFDSLRESVKDGDGGVAAPGVFVASSFFVGSSAGFSSFGAPSGKALLNLPVTSAAIVFLPLGVICLATSSGWANCSIMLGMSPACDEVSTSGRNVSEPPAFWAMLPDSMNIAELSCAVAMAFELKAALPRRLSQIG